jgi:hypothetical protein
VDVNTLNHVTRTISSPQEPTARNLDTKADGGKAGGEAKRAETACHGEA